MNIISVTERDNMDQNTLTVFNRILIAQLQNRLPGLRERIFAVESKDQAGPMDEADLACARYDKEFSMAIRSHNGRTVQEILEALARLRVGRFGLCEECGGQIGLKRLSAQPTASVCIDCAKEIEIRERRMLFQKAS